MIIGARTAAWSGVKLPYDAEVEWLQGHGFEYIDTGLILTDNDEVIIGLIASEYPSEVRGVFGARSNALQNNINVNINSGIVYSDFGNYTVCRASTTYKLDDEIIISSKKSENKVEVVGGATSVNTHGAETITTPTSAWIFGVSNTGWKFSSVRIKYVEIVGRFKAKPVIKNGVGYLYNEISGELFGNASRPGAFTWGDKVSVGVGGLNV